ncbi:MAG: hypothetical protein IJ649_08305 [Oscillospiraceae bacterium]|nr:hypothetical protein [Oscillospiraceae bacterium]
MATYLYHDGGSNGPVIARKCRCENKFMFWQHPDGKGGWAKGRGKAPHRLYVAGDLEGLVFVAEGEKDADTLHSMGFNAASGADGAGPGKWRKEYTEQLRGLYVCVLGDNDAVGRDYAAETCNALSGVAASVRFLDLATVWPEIPEHGDVSDLYAKVGPEHTAELLAQVSAGPEWEPTPPPPKEKPDSLKPSDYSDAGNAAVFTKIYIDDLIFVDALGWLWWNGKRWERDDHKALTWALDLSEQMLKEALAANRAALVKYAEAQAKYAETGDEADGEAVKDAEDEKKKAAGFLKHAQALRGAPRLRNMLDLSKPAFVIKADKLDANPVELNTPAGIVNLTTGQLRPHNRLAYCSQITEPAPGEQGREMWNDFLNTITGSDGSLRGFLQMVAGMALIGKVYHEGIVIAYGGGRNGKSTFFNALQIVLGDYAGTIDIKTLTTDRQNKGAALATLRGKRLVVTGELEEHQRLSVATLKQVASTDRLTIEEKYKSPETVKQTHTLVLFTNHLPRVGSTDSGTWRRLIVVPFTTTIPEGAGVQNYAEVLAEKAGGAILSWAIEGAINFVRNGFKLDLPDVVVEATEEYRQREDWLNNFISERCVREPNAQERARALYLAYKEWAQDAGEYVRRENDFSDAMEKAGFQYISPKNKKTYIGLRIDHSPEFANTYGTRDYGA